jgi:hypothetical protein
LFSLGVTAFRSPFIDDDDSWPKDILSIKEEPVETDEEIEVPESTPSVLFNISLGSKLIHKRCKKVVTRP